jgi:signal peptidase II
MRATRKRLLWMTAVAAAALVADQAAKWAVRVGIPRGEDWIRSAGVAIGHQRNNGIAFGLFAGSGRTAGILTAVMLPLVITCLSLLARRHPLAAVGAGLLIGGAASNLLDRLRQGAVTDFIELGPWPAFNLADLAVVCGAGLLLLVVGRDASPQGAAGTSAQP